MAHDKAGVVDVTGVDVTADASVSSPREGSPDTLSRDALPREIEELALIYGIEAHRYLGNAQWDAVRDDLAAGWSRIRRQRNVEWSRVAGRVAAGWHCRSAASGK